MKLTFAGASHEVTGSNFLLETKAARVLIDCGMFQGGDFNEKKNQESFLYEPASINAVCVTHPHYDHIGRIPKLVSEGFAGPIYMTKGCAGLARLIWEDAYGIMAYNNKKFRAPMLYSLDDVDAAVAQCKGVEYGETVDVAPGITGVWKDAGHIFGSAFIELFAEGKKIAVSGDIGNDNVPILRDTEPLSSDVDVLLCESTYGDRIHEETETGRALLLKMIQEGCKKGGVVMMPAFSLERTQEILYRMHRLWDEDKTLPNVPIFVDSPLAIRALDVYRAHPEYYDIEAMKKYTARDDFFDFPNLTLTFSKEESMRINSVPAPKVIIAGSGMMNGGRILHHALRYLSDPKSLLVLVGYQAQGTLGRKLYEGAQSVRIFDEEIPVRATVKAIGVLSAHGDQDKLLRWTGSSGASEVPRTINEAKRAPKKVFCVHGEAHAATELAHRIRDHFPSTEAFVPEFGQVVEI